MNNVADTIFGARFFASIGTSQFQTCSNIFFKFSTPQKPFHQLSTNESNLIAALAIKCSALDYKPKLTICAYNEKSLNSMCARNFGRSIEAWRVGGEIY